MALTNLKTAQKTVATTSVKLAVPADRIGLGFGAVLAYPADNLSQGQFPVPHNPEPEQLRSRQVGSAARMRKQTRTGDPGAVPPVGPTGCLNPGSSTVRAWWRVTVTGKSRDRNPKTCVRICSDRDCQSPVRSDEKHGLSREVAPIAAAKK